MSSYTILIEVSVNLPGKYVIQKLIFSMGCVLKTCIRFATLQSLGTNAVLYELLHIIVNNSTISSLNSLLILATRNSPCPAVCCGTTDSLGVF